MEGTNPALQHLLGAIMACTVQVNKREVEMVSGASDLDRVGEEWVREHLAPETLLSHKRRGSVSNLPLTPVLTQR